MRTLEGTWRRERGQSECYTHLYPLIAYDYMRPNDTMCDDPSGNWSAFRGDPVGQTREDMALENLINRHGLEMIISDFIAMITDNREHIRRSSNWNEMIRSRIRQPVTTFVEVTQTRSFGWPAIVSNLHVACAHSVLLNLRIVSEERFLMIQFNPDLSIGFINAACESIRTSCDIYINSYTIARCIRLANNYDYAYIRE